LKATIFSPIPENAVIENFSMFINGTETTAEMLEADKARSIYENIVRQIQDPALLEYSGRGLLKARIFPIEARSTKRVKISYREQIQKDNNVYKYTYPLNTEKFSSAPLKNVSVLIHLKSNEDIRNVSVPEYSTDVVWKNKKSVVVSYEDRKVKPDRDFSLYYTTPKSDIGVSLLTYKENQISKGYFFLQLDPGNEYDKSRVVPKDITFVLDTSGSMRGDKIEQAKEALRYCIKNLHSNDRFQIITFATEAEVLFSDLRKNSITVRRKALDFIDEIEAAGGTNIEDAFINTFQKRRSSRTHNVVFITDGKATIGSTEERKLFEVFEDLNSNGTKVFTFGIGDEINTLLLDKITDYTNAYRSYISPGENIQEEVSSFFSKVNSPVMTDIEIDFSGSVRISKLLPSSFPDMYSGTPVSFYGRYNGSGIVTMNVTGTLHGIKKRYSFPLNFKNRERSHKFVAPLYAARRVGYLLDQIRFYGEKNELVNEVTILAREFGIITPYTSYLIVEDERRRIHDRDISTEDVTLSNTIGSVAQEAMEDEYTAMQNSEGAPSVRASKDIQAIRKADTYDEIEKQNKRFGDSSGVQINTQNKAGRQFYQNNGYWNDSKIQNGSYSKVVRIKFGTDRYFKLAGNKTIAEILSVGKNVRFVLDKTLYEIYTD
jgi:Ca-activated chloride channel family protein